VVRQSAFRLTDGATTVFIDPFDDMTPLAERGLRWEYPAIEGVEADLVLVTHEHRDHNGVEAIAGEPVTLRSTAGRLESPIGEVLAVASEHDDAAGTERGPNTEPVDAFAALAERVERPESSAFDLDAVPSGDGPVVVVPSAP
jgi:glyoxylase-like metal-dependent hydrolase (beta-lactamase superfamily II)